jgi:hypothetical protein
VVGAIAALALELGEGRLSGLVGLVGGVIAAPGLLVAGAPFGDDDAYLLGIVASVPLWLLLGMLAARRATRSPMATWREFWREYAFLAVGVALGAIAALIASTVSLGESLI